MLKKKSLARGPAPGENLTVGTGQGEIHLAIDTKGNIILETMFTQGQACDRLVGGLESALGKVVNRTNKEHYYKDAQF